MVHARSTARYRGGFVAAGVILILVCVPYRAQPAQPHDQKTKQDQKQSDRPSVAASIVINIKDHDQSNASGSRSSEEISKHPEELPIQLTDKIMAGSAVVSAIFAIVVGIYTAKLFLVGRNQHDRLKESIDLANKEFIASHRPKIIARQLVLHFETKEKYMTIKYVLVNTGDTKAKITYRKVRSYIVEPDQIVLGLGFGDQIDEEEFILNSGEIFEGVYSSIGIFPDEWVRDILEGRLILKIFGDISYVDDNATKRRTAFARSYDAALRRFIRETDEDREYED